MKLQKPNNRILTIFILLIVFSCSSKYDTKFDSNKWKNWVETESSMSLRWDMRKDLIKEHKLTESTIAEITLLLGKPEQKTKNTFSYNLGVVGHGIDYGSLILTFQNDKVTGIEIIRH